MPITRDDFQVPDDPVTGFGELRLARGLESGGRARRMIAWAWLLAILGAIVFVVILTVR